MKKADENDSVFRREINGDGDGKIGLENCFLNSIKNLGTGAPF